MSPHDILIIEDEPSIAEVVELYLRRSGFEVRAASDGRSGLAEFDARVPDLVILDLMLPGIDGFDVARTMRSHTQVPIIMLTSRTDERDRIVGLEMGADDYVVKPFSPGELVSRVRAVLRRTQPVAEDVEPLTFDGLEIDQNARSVRVGGQARELTAKEFDLLVALASRPNTVLNRDQLLELAWDATAFIDPSTVTVHVRRLREKIEEDPSSPRWIETVFGVGYRFAP